MLASENSGSGICVDCSRSVSVRYSSEYSIKQSLKQYEDYCVAHPSLNSHQQDIAVYAIFDGHKGDSVSQFLAQHLVRQLEPRLPNNHPSPEQREESYAYAEKIRRAVAAAFLELAIGAQQNGADCSRNVHEAGCGSSAVVAVLTGRLLTVANCGTTKAVLDVGHTAYECTSDDRIGDNEEEEDRLAAIDACIARLRLDGAGPAGPGEVGCGPLRLWPGGLAMSRAIQEVDCAPLVLPHPFIQQVWLPLRASRLIIATDSVFNAFDTFHKAAGALRDVSLANAAAALLRCSQQRKQHRHDFVDASVLVVDFVPETGMPFKSQMRLDRLSRSSSCSGTVAARPAGSAASAGLLHRLVSRASSRSLEASSQCQQPQSFRRTSSGTSISSTGQAGLVTVRVVGAAEAKSYSAALGQQPKTSPTAELQQQQQQATTVSLLQKVGCLLCVLPATVNCLSQMQQQQQQQRAHLAGASGLATCGSKATSCSSWGKPMTAAGIGVLDTVSSNSRDGSSLQKASLNGVTGRVIGLFASSTTVGRPAGRRTSSKPGLQPVQPLPDPAASIRFVASVDSWRAYFGSYQGLHQQLAALNKSLGVAEGLSDRQTQQHSEQGCVRAGESTPAAAVGVAPAVVESCYVAAQPGDVTTSDSSCCQDQGKRQPQLSRHGGISMAHARGQDVGSAAVVASLSL